ncbi:MAG: imidazole glycerol phosphate synthase subunit HisH [Methanoregulaceae archaeon PtaB.Bin152]|nr:MAG: imidazole glycerol phosphate synthase subunit HisH [Methanoregulaceae archaeon PtaB.Bin152]
MKKIIIVDYGLGNLRSVRRGIEKSGGRPLISSDIEEISSAEGIVLPGVGAFRDGMQQLGALQRVLIASSSSVPVLGICLGMQMLMDWSEEHGVHRGLGLVPGVVRRFPRREGYKVPHMGWNTLTLPVAGHPLFEGIPSGEYMYFVHSYYVRPDDEKIVIATVDYGVEVPAMIEQDNVFATQFHPEKSGAIGLEILKNFLERV